MHSAKLAVAESHFGEILETAPKKPLCASTLEAGEGPSAKFIILIKIY